MTRGHQRRTCRAGSGAAFPGISSRAYEHPADRSALVALRKLTGFDTVFKALSGLLPERSLQTAVPVRLGAGQRRPVRAPQRHAAGRLLHPGPGEGPPDVRHAEPAAQRDVHRPRRADHRGHDGPGRAARRGGDAGGRRPRGGPRPLRPLGLPHDPALPDQPRAQGRLDPAGQRRDHGDRDGAARMVPQVGAVRGPGRAAGRPGPAGLDARADEDSRRQPPARDERGRVPGAGRGVRGGRRPARLRAEDPQRAAAHPPLHHGARRRAEEVGRDPRLPADHGRPLPAPRRGQGHLGLATPSGSPRPTTPTRSRAARTR